MIRRYLNLSWQEWCELGWDLQQAYLDGLSEDENVPLTFQDSGPEGFPEGMSPNIRKADAGTDVIDLKKMREDLEADRARKAGGG